MIKLGRLKIDNFKSFNESIYFDFSKRDLILFDGPNGFGKTTIFDAIELCFTGEVSRIKHTDTKTKKDHILKCDNSRPTSITLELINNIHTELVIEVFIPENISGMDGKVANYKKSIHRYEYSDWESSQSKEHNGVKLDADKLKRTLNNVKLDETFKLFNYIQQEETCHFLKLREDQRHEQISHLFGTTNESNKASKLDDISSKIKEYIDFYSIEETKVSNELNLLAKPVDTSSNAQEVLGSGKLSALENLSSFTVQQIKEYKVNLENVGWVISNHNIYIDLRRNFQISTLVENRTEEISNYIKLGTLERYDELTRIEKQYSRWRKTKEKAKRFEYLINEYNSKPNSINTDILEEYKVLFPVKYAQFSDKIDHLNSLKHTNQSYDSLLTSIEESRKNLISNYKSHIGTSDEKLKEEVPCPVCGDKKADWEALIDEYNNQTELFEQQLNDNEKSVKDLSSKIVAELVAPIVVKMTRFVSKYNHYLEYDFEVLYKHKFVSQDAFDRMYRVKLWLEANFEEASSYVDKGLREVRNNYLEATTTLVNYIKTHHRSIPTEVDHDYSFYLGSLEALSLTLQTDNTLLEKKRRVTVDIDDLSKDIQLVERLLTQKNSLSYQRKEQELNKIREKIELLKSKRLKVTEICNVYKKRIKSYEKNVAKNIAIPLFIYSSKILQSRPEGSGIFLITPSSNNSKGFIQFSATADDSHDAWNTMSSGQLSGIVISFMLAMNKVYPSKLSTLLIDDPVQTMDEVNMASFVQMLKYEFPLVQILLSTHESKVANYFNYKYSESGLNTLPINMKQKRLESKI